MRRRWQSSGAAVVVEESKLEGVWLAETIAALLGDSRRLEQMSEAARSLAHPNAARDIAAMAARVAGIEVRKKPRGTSPRFSAGFECMRIPVKADWGRRLKNVAIIALVLFVILYVGDWLVLRSRVARGTAFGSVEVHQFLATSLKGSKTEYDLVGTFQEACSRSIFPQQGKPRLLVAGAPQLAVGMKIN